MNRRILVSSLAFATLGRLWAAPDVTFNRTVYRLQGEVQIGNLADDYDTGWVTSTNPGLTGDHRNLDYTVGNSYQSVISRSYVTWAFTNDASGEHLHAATGMQSLAEGPQTRAQLFDSAYVYFDVNNAVNYTAYSDNNNPGDDYWVNSTLYRVVGETYDLQLVADITPNYAFGALDAGSYVWISRPFSTAGSNAYDDQHGSDAYLDFTPSYNGGSGSAPTPEPMSLCALGTGLVMLKRRTIKNHLLRNGNL